MIATEYAFADLAAKANTREAFLTYLADDAIMFADGPRNGRELYANHPVDDSLLAWAPSFADMAASGDFGYDTGPYTYRPKRSDEKPSGHGQWVTLWKKQTSGTWRVAFDTGLSHPAQEDFDLASVRCSTTTLSQISPDAPPVSSRQSLLDAERTLASEYRTSGIAAYEKMLSTEARLLYRGQFPAIGRDAFLLQLRRNLVHETPVEHSIIASEAAASNDLGYAYGWVKFRISTQEKSEERSVNYLRIWKRENVGDWRLVLELTGPG